LLTGILAALLGTLAPAIGAALAGSWQVLTLVVATLLLLLMLSLMIRGVVGLVRIMSSGSTA
jgi:hypothetical protein